MNRKRPDFADYLRSLDMSEEADSIEILSTNGGRRETDSYEVFPKIEKDGEGCFRCRFFLHGSRYVKAAAQERIRDLRHREPLQVILEHDNPATGLQCRSGPWTTTRSDGHPTISRVILATP